MLQQIQLSYENNSIAIQIIRSQRKTMALQIKPDLTVMVRAPKFIPEKNIRKFILDNREWINKHYKEMEENKLKNPMPTYDNLYVNGAKLPLLNEKFVLLEIKKGEKKSRTKVYYTTQIPKLIVVTASCDANDIRECVVSWYRHYSKEVIEEKVAYYAKNMQVSFGQISIRDQKSRWGSCSAKKNLNFNWRLVMMPEVVLDYVVIHELAHLKQLNHSPAFWREVEKVLPDYRIRKEWLKSHGKDYQKY